MPKGVEHTGKSTAPAIAPNSVESLMPKGVEHPRGGNHGGGRPSVESLMPKGVEHGLMIYFLRWYLLC